jgi:hypothetical protein
MKDNSKIRKTSKRERKKGRETGGDKIKIAKEEKIQRLPNFSAEASLYITTSHHYDLAGKYVQTPGATPINPASSFLSYFCYYNCMIKCGIICSRPRMCLISCPQQCRAQCEVYGR